MESLTIRVSRSTHGRLKELADSTGETMADIVEQAVKNYQKERFWAEYQTAYAAVQSDPTASADLQAEIDAWDGPLADGVEDHRDEHSA